MSELMARMRMAEATSAALAEGKAFRMAVDVLRSVILAEIESGTVDGEEAREFVASLEGLSNLIGEHMQDWIGPESDAWARKLAGLD